MRPEDVMEGTAGAALAGDPMTGEPMSQANLQPGETGGTPLSAAEAKKGPDVARSESAEGAHKLLCNLFPELFQTEQSALSHPQREAERLGSVPPAQALRAVSAHAERVLKELPELATQHNLPVSRLGQAVGQLFSNLRQWFADHLIDEERSYRGTLLGMRHGVDLVLLIRHAARVQGDPGLEGWCTTWLTERVPLVEEVAAQLGWFAVTPKVALQTA